VPNALFLMLMRIRSIWFSLKGDPSPSHRHAARTKGMTRDVKHAKSPYFDDHFFKKLFWMP